MIRPTSYLALDLELNGPDIIEVGVTIGSAHKPESEWVRMGWYVKPLSGNPIRPEITTLTGITQELIDRSGLDHETVAEELSGLIRNTPDLFVNPVQ